MRKLFGFLPVFIIGIFLSKNGWSQKLPPPPPPRVNLKHFTPPTITVKGKEANVFYQRNPTVESISRQGNTITLLLKSGKKEEYNMDKENERKDFANKYGNSPIPPPPPPRQN